MHQVKKFYDKLQFPGPYNYNGLEYHFPKIKNPYLQIIERNLESSCDLLDIGCGTGYIANLFAKKNPNINITALDFSDAIDFAQSFAQNHSINNVEFVKQDFMQFETSKQYDVVLAQGVLHHIPDFDGAWQKAKSLVKPGGKLILAVYHPWGKILKKLMTLDYRDSILEIDQEQHPYEASFVLSDLETNQIRLIETYPKSPKLHALLYPFRFSRSGGLTSYVFEKIK